MVLAPLLFSTSTHKEGKSCEARSILTIIWLDSFSLTKQTMRVIIGESFFFCTMVLKPGILKSASDTIEVVSVSTK